MFGTNEFFTAVKNGDVKAIQMLIEQGYDLGKRDYCGRTVLHYATEYGQTECLRLLVKLNCDLEAKVPLWRLCRQNIFVVNDDRNMKNRIQ